MDDMAEPALLLAVIVTLYCRLSISSVVVKMTLFPVIESVPSSKLSPVSRFKTVTPTSHTEVVYRTVNVMITFKLLDKLWLSVSRFSIN